MDAKILSAATLRDEKLGNLCSGDTFRAIYGKEIQVNSHDVIAFLTAID